MKRYVVGFLFSVGGKQVLLIRKERPGWQKGYLTGVGGHIERDETPIAAMTLEFEEEAGLHIDHWVPVAVLSGENFEVHFFATNRGNIFKARSMTDEKLETWPVADVLSAGSQVIANLQVLIPLALDDSGIVKPVQLRDEMGRAT